MYSHNIENGEFKVSAWDNSDATINVCAEQIEEGKLKVTPWVSFTDIWLNKGSVIYLNATGSITLGAFSVYCYPDGISGFRTYNVDGRFNHGCLIGKIGDGDWFYVGTQKTVTADRDGRLQLRINDDREADNDGYFVVKYNLTE